jgi:hypothetical protein
VIEFIPQEDLDNQEEIQKMLDMQVFDLFRKDFSSPDDIEILDRLKTELVMTGTIDLNIQDPNYYDVESAEEAEEAEVQLNSKFNSVKKCHFGASCRNLINQKCQFRHDSKDIPCKFKDNCNKREKCIFKH